MIGHAKATGPKPLGTQRMLCAISRFVHAISPPQMQVTEYMNAGARQWCFLVKGLREVEATLKEMGIPFFLLFGEDIVPLG